MNVIFPLAILAVVLAGIFLIAFLFALNSGQFDDSQTPPRRILMDGGEHLTSQNSEKKK